jgi:hypothetical protein
MATKKLEGAAVYPAPAGCAPHERADWLPKLAPLPWLQELRERHVECAHAWARAMDEVDAVRDDAAEREDEYRRVVRQATADGVEIPPRAGELDPARWEARRSIAVEDAAAARDDLAEAVLESLAALRAHRAELRPYLSTLSPALLQAVATGAHDQRGIVAERLRRQIAELEADGPAIEIIDEPAGQIPESEEQHV